MEVPKLNLKEETTKQEEVAVVANTPEKQPKFFKSKKPLEGGGAYGTGRRKNSVARVWVRPGKGIIKVNNKDYADYFSRFSYRKLIMQPFEDTKTTGQYDVICTATGGGTTGQAGAIVHGIARALDCILTDGHTILRKGGYLTRDSRKVERKKILSTNKGKFLNKFFGLNNNELISADQNNIYYNKLFAILKVYVGFQKKDLCLKAMNFNEYNDTNRIFEEAELILSNYNIYQNVNLFDDLIYFFVQKKNIYNSTNFGGWGTFSKAADLVHEVWQKDCKNSGIDVSMTKSTSTKFSALNKSLTVIDLIMKETNLELLKWANQYYNDKGYTLKNYQNPNNGDTICHRMNQIVYNEFLYKEKVSQNSIELINYINQNNLVGTSNNGGIKNYQTQPQSPEETAILLSRSLKDKLQMKYGDMRVKELCQNYLNCILSLYKGHISDKSDQDLLNDPTLVVSDNFKDEEEQKYKNDGGNNNQSKQPQFNKEVEKELLAANLYHLQNKVNELNKMINDANDKNVKFTTCGLFKDFYREMGKQHTIHQKTYQDLYNQYYSVLKGDKFDKHYSQLAKIIDPCNMLFHYIVYNWGIVKNIKNFGMVLQTLLTKGLETNGYDAYITAIEYALWKTDTVDFIEFCMQAGIDPKISIYDNTKGFFNGEKWISLNNSFGQPKIVESTIMHVLIGEYLRSIDLRCNDYAKTYHQKYYMTPECTVVYRDKLLDLIKKLVNDFNFDLNSTDYAENPVYIYILGNLGNDPKMNDIIEDLFKELCKLQKNIISQELIECFVKAGYAIQTKVIIDCANMFGVPLDLDECQKIATDNKHNDLALIIKLLAQQNNNTKITLNNDYDDDGKDDQKDDEKDDQKNDQDIIIGSNMPGIGAPDDVNNNSLALGGDNTNNDGNLEDID